MTGVQTCAVPIWPRLLYLAWPSRGRVGPELAGSQEFQGGGRGLPETYPGWYQMGAGPRADECQAAKAGGGIGKGCSPNAAAPNYGPQSLEPEARMRHVE